MLLDGQSPSSDTISSILYQLQIVYRELAAADVVGEADVSSVLSLVGEAVAELEGLEEFSGRTAEFMSPVVHEGVVGRPRYFIPQDVLQNLLSTGFSVPHISDILCIYIRTVHRRLSECGLSVRATYSVISDAQLDEIVARVQHEFPLCGYRQMIGHLRAQGLRIQQSRVRESQRRVDPGGCVMRRLSTVNRRTYRVNGPLAVWHIDGNHKLIR